MSIGPFVINIDLVIKTFTLTAMLVGLLVLPLLPGLVIIWVAALGYGLAAGFGTLGWIMFALITVLMLAGSVIDTPYRPLLCVEMICKNLLTLPCVKVAAPPAALSCVIDDNSGTPALRSYTAGPPPPPRPSKRRRSNTSRNRSKARRAAKSPAPWPSCASSPCS